MPRRAKSTAIPKLRPADHGLTHAYIGYGKGKTTAAVGSAVRAAGYGWRALFLQFMKSPQWESGERKPLKQLGVDVRVMGTGFYKIMGDKQPAAVHLTAAAKALDASRRALLSGTYDLVILDELGSAVEEKLLPRRLVEDMLKARARSKKARMVHLIWTGHKKIEWMLKYADLISEMKLLRHPFNDGIIALKGIDY